MQAFAQEFMAMISVDAIFIMRAALPLAVARRLFGDRAGSIESRASKSI